MQAELVAKGLYRAYLEVVHGVLKTRAHIDIPLGCNVPNVSVDKDLTRSEPHQDVGLQLRRGCSENRLAAASVGVHAENISGRSAQQLRLRKRGALNRDKPEAAARQSRTPARGSQSNQSRGIQGVAAMPASRRTQETWPVRRKPISCVHRLGGTGR